EDDDVVVVRAPGELAGDDLAQLVHLEPVEDPVLDRLDEIASLLTRLRARIAAHERRPFQHDVVELALRQAVGADRAHERAGQQPLAAQHGILRRRRGDDDVALAGLARLLRPRAVVLRAERGDPLRVASLDDDTFEAAQRIAQSLDVRSGLPAVPEHAERAGTAPREPGRRHRRRRSGAQPSHPLRLDDRLEPPVEREEHDEERRTGGRPRKRLEPRVAEPAVDARHRRERAVGQVEADARAAVDVAGGEAFERRLDRREGIGRRKQLRDLALGHVQGHHGIMLAMTDGAPTDPNLQLGLSAAEAERRLAARGPAPEPQGTRSYKSIVRANLLTVFNLILAVAGALTLVFGDWQDALFLGILVANSGIGIAQEIRAKKALDRLSALVAPNATVVRDGTASTVAVEDVVPGDLVRIGPGDQIVADGTLVQAEGVELDESILSGESHAVARRAGDEVRSGSFAVEGAGAYTVTAVGEQSYAARLTGEARSFRHPRSPLERQINVLLFVLVAAMIPLGVALGYSLWHRPAPLHTAVPTSVAAVVTLVPEGLVLLASVTFAVAAMRMARRGALAQQLNAIESIASVDVVCTDKTGTLTESTLRVTGVVGPESLPDELGRYAASATSRNATLEAIAAAYPAPSARVDEQVPFTSRRKFGAQRIGGVGYVLGAPEHFELNGLAAHADEAAGDGRRVLAFGTADPLDAPRPPAHGL